MGTTDEQAIAQMLLDLGLGRRHEISTPQADARGRAIQIDERAQDAAVQKARMDHQKKVDRLTNDTLQNKAIKAWNGAALEVDDTQHRLEARWAGQGHRMGNNLDVDADFDRLINQVGEERAMWKTQRGRKLEHTQSRARVLSPRAQGTVRYIKGVEVSNTTQSVHAPSRQENKAPSLQAGIGKGCMTSEPHYPATARARHENNTPLPESARVNYAAATKPSAPTPFPAHHKSMGPPAITASEGVTISNSCHLGINPLDRESMVPPSKVVSVKGLDTGEYSGSTQRRKRRQKKVGSSEAASVESANTGKSHRSARSRKNKAPPLDVLETLGGSVSSKPSDFFKKMGIPFPIKKYFTFNDLKKAAPQDVTIEEVREITIKIFDPFRKDWFESHPHLLQCTQDMGGLLKTEMFKIAKACDRECKIKFLNEFGFVPDIADHLDAAFRARELVKVDCPEVGNYFAENGQYQAFYNMAKQEKNLNTAPIPAVVDKQHVVTTKDAEVETVNTQVATTKDSPIEAIESHIATTKDVLLDTVKAHAAASTDEQHSNTADAGFTTLNELTTSADINEQHGNTTDAGPLKLNEPPVVAGIDEQYITTANASVEKAEPRVAASIDVLATLEKNSRLMLEKSRSSVGGVAKKNGIFHWDA
ncbi:hypothetical protein AMS68_002874 [Peltaster fructicola]|uniref:Uncharacterized protein n=1 Tax=Peltaster fructicola TaxID=286661 RepID=A0A6H0XRH3_9PEZI|nr:hypothetical protein AMS68_002874 [Peltaster fructicola]